MKSGEPSNSPTQIPDRVQLQHHVNEEKSPGDPDIIDDNDPGSQPSTIQPSVVVAKVLPNQENEIKLEKLSKNARRKKKFRERRLRVKEIKKILSEHKASRQKRESQEAPGTSSSGAIKSSSPGQVSGISDSEINSSSTTPTHIRQREDNSRKRQNDEAPKVDGKTTEDGEPMNKKKMREAEVDDTSNEPIRPGGSAPLSTSLNTNDPLLLRLYSYLLAEYIQDAGTLATLNHSQSSVLDFCRKLIDIVAENGVCSLMQSEEFKRDRLELVQASEHLKCTKQQAAIVNLEYKLTPFGETTFKKLTGTQGFRPFLLKLLLFDWESERQQEPGSDLTRHEVPSDDQSVRELRCYLWRTFYIDVKGSASISSDKLHSIAGSVDSIMNAIIKKGLINESSSLLDALCDIDYSTLGPEGPARSHVLRFFLEKLAAEETKYGSQQAKMSTSKGSRKHDLDAEPNLGAPLAMASQGCGKTSPRETETSNSLQSDALVAVAEEPSLGSMPRKKKCAYREIISDKSLEISDDYFTLFGRFVKEKCVERNGTDIQPEETLENISESAIKIVDILKSGMLHSPALAQIADPDLSRSLRKTLADSSLPTLKTELWKSHEAKFDEGHYRGIDFPSGFTHSGLHDLIFEFNWLLCEEYHRSHSSRPGGRQSLPGEVDAGFQDLYVYLVESMVKKNGGASELLDLISSCQKAIAALVQSIGTDAPHEKDLISYCETAAIESVTKESKKFSKVKNIRMYLGENLKVFFIDLKLMKNYDKIGPKDISCLDFEQIACQFFIDRSIGKNGEIIKEIMLKLRSESAKLRSGIPALVDVARYHEEFKTYLVQTFNKKQQGQKEPALANVNESCEKVIQFMTKFDSLGPKAQNFVSRDDVSNGVGGGIPLFNEKTSSFRSPAWRNDYLADGPNDINWDTFLYHLFSFSWNLCKGVEDCPRLEKLADADEATYYAKLRAYLVRCCKQILSSPDSVDGPAISAEAVCDKLMQVAIESQARETLVATFTSLSISEVLIRSPKKTLNSIKSVFSANFKNRSINLMNKCYVRYGHGPKEITFRQFHDMVFQFHWYDALQTFEW